MLAAIMHFDQPWMLSEGAQYDEDEERKKIDPSKLGRIEDDQLRFTEEELNWIPKHYQLLQKSR